MYNSRTWLYELGLPSLSHAVHSRPVHTVWKYLKSLGFFSGLFKWILIELLSLWFIVNFYHRFTYCENKTWQWHNLTMGRWLLWFVTTTEQISLCLGSQTIANVLTVTNEKLTLVVPLKYKNKHWFH